MASTVSTVEISNLSGAVVFVGYVLAALFLTIFLTYSLLTTYIALDSAYQHVIDKKLQILTVLSGISFCTLSYNMLGYLIVSYKAWALTRNVPLPARLYDLMKIVSYSDQEPQLHIWRWLKTSTLFKDFAQTICGSSEAFFWTGQALVTTMAWSIFLSIEGRRLRIPHLWAYAFIGQILPVSFAMNLFFIAMLVCCPIGPNSGWMVDTTGSIHLVGDPKHFKSFESNSLSHEAKRKESVVRTGNVAKIPCRTTNGITDLLLQDVTYIPEFFPCVISAPKLSSAGYTWKHSLKGLKFSNKDVTFTASIHPAGLYFIDTAPPSVTCEASKTHDDDDVLHQRVMLSATILFALTLHLIPLYAAADTQSNIFISLILTIRLLIFLPFLLSYATHPSSSSSTFSGSQSWPSRAQKVAYQSYSVLFFCLAIIEVTPCFLASFFVLWEETTMIQRSRSPLRVVVVVLEAINKDPAISALGYDLLLAWVSGFIWSMDDEDEFTVSGAVSACMRAVLRVIPVVQDLWFGDGELRRR